MRQAEEHLCVFAWEQVRASVREQSGRIEKWSCVPRPLTLKRCDGDAVVRDAQLLAIVVQSSKQVSEGGNVICVRE